MQGYQFFGHLYSIFDASKIHDTHAVIPAFAGMTSPAFQFPLCQFEKFSTVFNYGKLNNIRKAEWHSVFRRIVYFRSIVCTLRRLNG